MKHCANKLCPCINPQPHSEFYKKSRSKSGLTPRCKTCIKEYENNTSKKYYEQNKERLKEYSRNYRKNNKEKINSHRREYYRRNPYTILNSTQKRIALKNELKATLTKQEWEEILDKFNYSCAYCGVNQNELDYTLHQEHIVPLSKGGEYTKENIIPACKSCNCKKHNRTPQEAGMEILK